MCSPADMDAVGAARVGDGAFVGTGVGSGTMVTVGGTGVSVGRRVIVGGRAVLVGSLVSVGGSRVGVGSGGAVGGEAGVRRTTVGTIVAVGTRVEDGVLPAVATLLVFVGNGI